MHKAAWHELCLQHEKFKPKDKIIKLYQEGKSQNVTKDAGCSGPSTNKMGRL